MLERTIEILGELVGLDSTSARSNLPVIEAIEARLAGTASIIERVDPTPVPMMPPAEKANLLVRIGPNTPGGVILSAHTDCVPVEGQDWDTDPFELTPVDNGDGPRLAGRGTVDMKGFIACVLAAAASWTDLQRPVWLAFSHDEEVGGQGALSLAPALKAAGAAPDAVIVGEPTSLRIIDAHKGIQSALMRFHGHAAHSSRPDLGSNAATAASRVAKRALDEVDALAAAASYDRFAPPTTTGNVGRLQTGHAPNIIPDLAELIWEYRGLPGQDGPEVLDRVLAYADGEILDQMRATHPDASIEYFITSIPALRPDDQGAEDFVRRLTGDSSPATTAPFATDAPRFQHEGWSTVICGPGSIDVAHQPNEWISIDQLEQCLAMLGKLGDALREPEAVRR